jgi:tetratricopeptide (TPR) repeat protein
MSAKKRRPQRSPMGAPRLINLAELQRAAALMERERWREAQEVLETLHRRHPGRAEVLLPLMEVAYQLHDYRRYETVCEQLLRLQPDDPDLNVTMAAAYLLNFRPARALLAFRRFLERWPDHEQADHARQTAGELEEKIGEMVRDSAIAGKDEVELAALHEETQSLLERGQFADTRRVAAKLLDRCPRFAPALNNISQTYFAEGNMAQAVATTQRVLDFEPENVHALSNLSRYRCLSGDLEGARQYAARLRASTAAAADRALKIAEAFSYLGDDQAVLDAYRSAEEGRADDTSLNNPLLHHLAAVAVMRLGDEKEARKHWQRALAIDPDFQLAQDNLNDLRQPVGKRHAPWPFTLGNWITPEAVREIQETIGRSAQSQQENAVLRAAQALLRKHPEIVAITPLLLDRGDPTGRELAWRFAAVTQNPDMLAALPDFARSARGPDELRMKASQAAMQAGLMPSGSTRMWIQGEWHEVILMGFELYSESEDVLTEAASDLTEKAIEAIQAGDGRRGEELIKRALEIEPDHPSLLNNLAAAYSRQGCSKEAEAVIRQIYERHPDYFFGHTNMAMMLIQKKELKQARALLNPLLTSKRLHFSEFAALCGTEVELELAEGRMDAARGWLDMWAQADPDHPWLQSLRKRVNLAQAPGWLLGRRRRRS